MKYLKRFLVGLLAVLALILIVILFLAASGLWIVFLPLTIVIVILCGIYDLGKDLIE